MRAKNGGEKRKERRESLDHVQSCNAGPSRSGGPSGEGGDLNKV